MTAKADTRIRRLPEKGRQDLQLAYDIIDEAWIGHLGFTVDDQPYVVPMALGRDDDSILLHGSVASRLVKNLSAGLPCCLTVTHLDGLVLARSAFNSSMHYRSLMVFGTASVISDADAKKRGSRRIVGVMGCMVQRLQERVFEKSPGLDFAVGTHRLSEIPDIIEQVIAGRRRILDASEAGDAYEHLTGHTQTGISAFVNILYGCNRRCTYCIVPRVRGPEWSRPAASN